MEKSGNSIRSGKLRENQIYTERLENLLEQSKKYMNVLKALFLKNIVTESTLTTYAFQWVLAVQ